MSSNKEYFDKIGIFVTPSSFEKMCERKCSRRKSECIHPNNNNDNHNLTSSNSNCKPRKRAKKAFELAHDIRKFEISLFWKRGTYFWAFILGIYTVHFFLLSTFIKTEHHGKETAILYLTCMPLYAKWILFLTAFLGFFFCLSWVLINKGSKFWQKNWEAHLDMLEDEFSGKLYKVVLDTTDRNEFNEGIFNLQAYDYSVTKVTMMGSIVLMCASVLVLAMHTALVFPCLENILRTIAAQNCLLLLSKFIICLFAIVSVYFLISKCSGNPKNGTTTYKWIKRHVKS